MSSWSALPLTVGAAPASGAGGRPHRRPSRTFLKEETYVSTVLGFAAVAALAVRPHAPEEPWFRLVGSLMPLSLLVGALLAGLASEEQSTQTGNRHMQEGKTMNYSERLDTLQQRVAAAKAAVQDGARESREQLKQRINQAQADVDRATDSARQRADQAGADARSKWTQIRADAAAKMEDVKGKIDKRNRELDAKAAANDADWAETDAIDALDFADWAVDSARLTMLDAIDARAYAEQLAKAASS